jgi:hypothetical protein
MVQSLDNVRGSVNRIRDTVYRVEPDRRGHAPTLIRGAPDRRPAEAFRHFRGTCAQAPMGTAITASTRPPRRMPASTTLIPPLRQGRCLLHLRETSIMFTHASGYSFFDRYGFYECIIVNPSHWPASALWCHVSESRAVTNWPFRVASPAANGIHVHSISLSDRATQRAK